jgi:hypothetical protein
LDALSTLIRRIDQNSEQHRRRIDILERQWNRRLTELTARLDRLERERNTDLDGPNG